MKRREFIALLGISTAWPVAARAQRTTMPVIGFLDLSSELRQQLAVEAFRSGLVELGYTEGESIRVLYRFADGRAEHLSSLAIELVSLGAKIIVTSGTTAIRAIHAAVPNIPIVSRASADPVAMGWAHTLARPGGVITGLFLINAMAKPLELLREVRRNATTFACLMNATNPGNPYWKGSAGDAGRELGIKVEFFEVTAPSELADAFSRMGSARIEGVFTIPDPVLAAYFPEIADLARLHKLPSVGDSRTFVAAGGLFALAQNYPAMAKRSAWFVDQILKGVPPGELPAERSTELKLFVNLRTAKELGITIPPTVFGRADEVIE